MLKAPVAKDGRSWEEWRRRTHESPDPRVQAIRCTSCYRLRQHPKTDDPRTHLCVCGGNSFVNTYPHPDEVQLAIKLYTREIEEGNLYSKIAQEVVGDYEKT